MTVVTLAVNRYLELRSSELCTRLFNGNKCWLWLLPPMFYGLCLSSSIDLPMIYNSEWSAYMFQIDLRPGAPLVSLQE